MEKQLNIIEEDTFLEELRKLLSSWNQTLNDSNAILQTLIQYRRTIERIEAKQDLIYNIIQKLNVQELKQDDRGQDNKN